jgi:hypothetical protein
MDSWIMVINFERESAKVNEAIASYHKEDLKKGLQKSSTHLALKGKSDENELIWRRSGKISSQFERRELVYTRSTGLSNLY